MLSPERRTELMRLLAIFTEADGEEAQEAAREEIVKLTERWIDSAHSKGWYDALRDHYAE